MKIIRHADDLGITHQSTRQLIDAWRRGDLDSFSIIANGEAIKLTSKELKKSSERPAQVAVHFNLTEGYPSAPPSKIPLLVNDKGKLKHSFFSLLMIFLFSTSNKRQQLKEQIARECNAQIGFVQSICGTRPITSIDSHNHIHMIPALFDVVSRCALSANIFKIRISNEPFYLENNRKDWKQLFWWKNLTKNLLLKLLSISARRKITPLGLTAPNAVIGILYSGKMSAARALRGIKAVRAGHNPAIEIIFHIGRAACNEVSRWDNPREASFHLSKWRDIERSELRLFTNLIHTIKDS